MASLIVVKGNQPLDATIVATLAIVLSSAGVTHMYKMPGPEVRVMITTAVAIRAMIVALFVVVGRFVVAPMPWIPMSTRGIGLVSLKQINQDHLVIMSIGMIKLNQKIEFRNCSLQHIA